MIQVKEKVFAPCDGEISNLFETFHAVGITSDTGAEILIHIGLDTVNLGGEGFTAHCRVGDKVKEGDLLLEFDIPFIKSQGLPTITPVVIANSDEYAFVESGFGTIKPGDKMIVLSNSKVDLK